jgi:hypothetical protein
VFEGGQPYSSGGTIGDIWNDSSTGKVKYWNGSSWQQFSITADSILANNIAAGTLASNVIYAGSINASNITAGTIDVARLPGLSSVISQPVSYSYTGSSYIYNTTIATLTASGLLSGSKVIAGFSGVCYATSNANNNPPSIKPDINIAGSNQDYGTLSPISTSQFQPLTRIKAFSETDTEDPLRENAFIRVKG